MVNIRLCLQSGSVSSDCPQRTPMQCGRRLAGVEHSTNRLYRAIKKKVCLRSLTGSSNMCCLEMLIKLSESCGC